VAAVLRRVTGKNLEITSYTALFRHAQALDLERLTDLRQALGIGEDALMTWGELGAATSENRATIANHTMSHPLLKHVSGEWLDFELLESRTRLEERLGVTVHNLVFPYGTRENATPVVVEATRQAGYRAAYLVRMGVARPGAFLLPRAPLEARPPLDRLTTSHALNTLATLARA
jgi:peptidoglycan/xylan/chitin deacetylase (PgdA/CDA1 family)